MTDSFSTVLDRFLSTTQSSKKGKGKVRNNFLSTLPSKATKPSWDETPETLNSSIKDYHSKHPESPGML